MQNITSIGDHEKILDKGLLKRKKAQDLRNHISIYNVVCNEFIHRKMMRTEAQDFKLIVYSVFITITHVAIIGSIRNEIRVPLYRNVRSHDRPAPAHQSCQHVKSMSLRSLISSNIN